jgi:Xaa-Pro aminopeptidase
MSKLIPPAPIPRDEFFARRDAAVAAARARGLDGLLVVGRGGGAVDRYGDLCWLTDHYTSFPFIPDVAGRWTARGHAFLALPSNGGPKLVIDMPSTHRVAMPAEQVAVADLVLEETIAALRATGLASGTIGLVGGDTIALSMFRAIEAALPGLRMIPADDILGALRSIKSPGEVARLRDASRIGSRMIDAMMDAAEPGATHADVLAAGMAVLIPAGGILYNSFMASGSGGDDPKAVRSTFPTWASPEPLGNGQWFRSGISGVLNGYYFDLARARPIGPPTNSQVDAFEAAIAVIDAGKQAIRPGATAGDIARAGMARQAELGYPPGGVFSGLGHGVGMGWDVPWLNEEDTTPIVPGMVLCLEKTLSRDGWLGDFEETVLVTEAGCELITDARIRRW